jgi:hypothetical protein
MTESSKKIEIIQENKVYTTVRIEGVFEISDIKKSADVYIDLFKKGVRKILIDVSNATSDIGPLLKSHEDLDKGLSKFDKIAILVKSSDVAFKVKTAAAKNTKIHVFYEKPSSETWLTE